MKFLHTLIAREIPENIKQCLEEQPARSGMYNWIFAFRGSIASYWSVQDNLEDYDVIQVNMSPKDMPIIPMIREKLRNSSTKLVINNDYICEYWGKFGLDPWQYDHIQKMGDMVFSTEPHQVSNMIKGTYLLPHPTNTRLLKHLGHNEDRESIGFIYHWWAGSTHLPARTMALAANRYGLKTALYGYIKAGANPVENERWIPSMFDKVYPGMSFPEFAELIQGEKVVYDPNMFHTYGRNGVELACFRKPVIGSNRVFSYNKLFPDLTIDPLDHNDAMAKFDKVVNGKIDDILDRAYDEVEYFNYKNSIERFKAALEESTERGGYKWYEENNK